MTKCYSKGRSNWWFLAALALAFLVGLAANRLLKSVVPAPAPTPSPPSAPR